VRHGGGSGGPGSEREVGGAGLGVFGESRERGRLTNGEEGVLGNGEIVR